MKKEIPIEIQERTLQNIKNYGRPAKEIYGRLSYIIDYLDGLDPSQIRQYMGNITDIPKDDVVGSNNYKKCGCVGAHVAYISVESTSYKQGISYLMNLLRMSRRDLDAALNHCGAAVYIPKVGIDAGKPTVESTFNTFGTRIWATNPAKVFRNLRDSLFPKEPS